MDTIIYSTAIKSLYLNILLVFTIKVLSAALRSKVFVVATVLGNLQGYVMRSENFMGREMRDSRLLARPAAGERLTHFLTHKYTLLSIYSDLKVLCGFCLNPN